MSIADLCFYVFVRGTTTIDAIRDVVLASFPTSSPGLGSDIELDENVIEFEVSEEWVDGAEETDDPLTWKYALQVFPINELRTKEQQIEIARRILSTFRASGLTVEVGANFEDEL